MPAPLRRISCDACLRPRRTCICHWIARTANDVEVLILQHPAEVRHAKGSARLLHLSLMRSHLEVGDTFAENRLQALLHGSIDDPAHTVLLYPPAAVIASASAPDPAWMAQPRRLRLVVIDATWRKSLKMLHDNPLLRTLPRLALDDVPPSTYLIRKAHRPHQLSTLEAACHALMRIENDAGRYRPLLTAFDGFVHQQLSFCETR